MLVNYATQNFPREVISARSFPIPESEHPSAFTEMRLQPGWQAIPKSLWDAVLAIKPHRAAIQDLIADNILIIQETDNEMEAIAHWPEDRQIQIIAETYDEELLENWLDTPSSRAIERAILNQLDEIAPDPDIEDQKPDRLKRSRRESVGERDRRTKHESIKQIKTRKRSTAEKAMVDEIEALKAQVRQLMSDRAPSVPEAKVESSKNTKRSQSTKSKPESEGSPDETPVNSKPPKK